MTGDDAIAIGAAFINMLMIGVAILATDLMGAHRHGKYKTEQGNPDENQVKKNAWSFHALKYIPTT